MHRIPKVLFWIFLAFIVKLMSPLFFAFLQPMKRLHMRCLAKAFISGTGWGGDEAVAEIIMQIPDCEIVLKDIVKIEESGGIKDSVHSRLLKYAEMRKNHNN